MRAPMLGPLHCSRPLPTPEIKILTKELIIPTGADRGVFVMAPVLMVAVAIAVWAVIPLGPTGLQVVDLDIGAFYVVAISSLAPFSASYGRLELAQQVC